MDASDQRVKHLQLIQAVVTRMAQNSFAVRGWSVTLVSVLFALIVAKDAPPAAALVALVPAMVFWGLDAYYVSQERLFRALYAAAAGDVAAGTAVVPVFSMNPTPYGKANWRAALLSRTAVPIPAVLAVIAIGYVVVTAVR